MKTTIKNITDFYHNNPECIGKINANTRFGMKCIQYADITAYDSEVYEIYLLNGEKLKGSPDHLIWCNDNWCKLSKIIVDELVLTKNGYVKVIKVEKLKYKQNLYDLQIEDVHEFYANNIVSHNSSFLDAFAFVWYGRAFRNINKAQLVNTINDADMLIESNAISGGHRYKVVRGLKPAIFEIWEDDKLLPQSATRDYQSIIEDQILKMNFKAFTQIVMIGVASYVPFMKLTAPNRRAVIEDLLDIEVFSIMNAILKKRMTTNKEEIIAVNNKTSLVEQKIFLHKKHLSSIKDNNDAVIKSKQDKIEENNQYIVEATNSQYSLQTRIASIDIQSKDLLLRKKNEYRDYEIKLNSKSSRLQNEIKFFNENDNCPKCNQAISFDLKTISFNELQKKLNEINNGLEKLNNLQEDINEKLKIIDQKSIEISELKNEITILSDEVKLRQRQSSELEKEIIELSKETSIDENELVTFKSELMDCYEEKERLIIEKNTQEIGSLLLSDSGIKSKIIKQYIPVMNKLINKYLASMEFACMFEFDENFNETVKSRFRDDFTYDSFSAGERQRLDLALLFCWRAIAKMRNSASTNLLIMDEVFDSSLDVTGTEELLKILQGLTSDTNSFIISHRTDLVDKFSNVLSFQKHNNFSRIVEDSVL